MTSVALQSRPTHIVRMTDSSAIKDQTGQPPRGWYYGMVESKAGARSRAIVAKVFKEDKLELKYWSDDYSDDLPYWIRYPGTDEAEEKGLCVVPYA